MLCCARWACMCTLRLLTLVCVVRVRICGRHLLGGLTTVTMTMTGTLHVTVCVGCVCGRERHGAAAPAERLTSELHAANVERRARLHYTLAGAGVAAGCWLL